MSQNEKNYKDFKIKFGKWKKEWDNILTSPALDFLQKIIKKFSDEHRQLLDERKIVQKKINSGIFPNFLEETKAIRSEDWKASPVPQDLLDRRVEITGPVDRKMIINGLNSGAKVYMADFEDSQSPTWDGLVDGQVNLYDAVRKKIEFQNPSGKQYRLNSSTAVLIVRPRGLHLWEKHITYKGKPISGAFFDFAFYIFHNANEAINQGTGPYFYIPKIENHKEAILWAKVFSFAEETLGLKKGRIKATVLIETITAVFEMHEIIYELKDYIAGLNCGRWDYIFSFIKKFHKSKEFVLPNREQVGMEVHFLKSYSLLLIKTCHKRGIHAMGGMAAQIPIKNNDALNDTALNKVRVDKEREAQNGHDGTWVAHPGLVPIATEIFDRVMPQPNQIHKQINVNISAKDLLQVPKGTITLEGFTNNVKVALHYTAAWISGNGCVPLNNLMEDMATAEIARSQLWQWLHYQSTLDDGTLIDSSLYQKVMDEAIQEAELSRTPLSAPLTDYKRACEVINQTVNDKEFLEFLTLKAYDYLD